MLSALGDFPGGILSIALSNSTRDRGWLTEGYRDEIKHSSGNLLEPWISASVSFEDAKRIRLDGCGVRGKEGSS